MNTAVIGVGSNIDALPHIAQAKSILGQEQLLISASRFVKTAPIGFADQPDFINGAFLIGTNLDHNAFNAYLKQVEYRFGRIKTGNTYGPRTIDLDIVVWNGLIVSDDFYKREFVRNAVIELVPDLAIHNH